MKTSYKAFAFAILAAFIVALAVVPADDSSAATTAEPKMLNAEDGTTWVQITFDTEITSPLTFSVYDSDRALVKSVQQPNVASLGTVYTFQLGTNLADLGTATYYMTVVVGGQTLFNNVPDTPAPTPGDDKYTVSIATDIQNGAVSADKTEAAEGETVTLTVTANDGYKVASVSAGDEAIVANEGVYSFTMPAQNVTVTATFEATGSVDEPTYAITIASDIQNGTVTADKATAKAGEVISLTAEPATGYVLDAYSVTLAGGQSVAVDNGTFTMPSEAVTVSATFKVSETPAPTPGDEYTVTVSNTLGGTVTASADSAKAGDRIVLTVETDDGYTVDAVTYNGTALTAPGAKTIANLFIGSATYGSWSVKDADADKATLVLSYTTSRGANTKEVVVSNDADYSALAAQITGDSKYTVVDTSAITGADVTAGYRSMGAAYLVKIAASADGYVANAVEVDGSSTYLYVTGYTADTIGAEVQAIASELAAALVSGATYNFAMPAESVTVAASFIKYEQASLSGSVKTAGTVFDKQQIVNITADTTLVSGANVTIQGILNVPAGVTLTIQAGAYLLVTGTANIEGTVVIDAADADNNLAPGALIAYEGGVVNLSGSVAVNGVLGSMTTGKVAVAAASAVEIAESGAVVGAVSIADSASMTVAGSFGYTSQGVYYPVSFEVAGTLTVDTEVPAQNGFSAKLTSNSASVVVEKIVYGESIETGMTAGVPGAVITVTDSADNSVVISTSLTTAASAPADANDYPVNATATLSGITVSETSKPNSTGMSTVATIVLSGTVDAESSVEYGGVAEVPEYTLAVTVAVTGTTGASIAASAIGEGVALSVSGTASIDAALALGESVALTSDASLTVAAAVNATADKATIANNGKLTMSGEGAITALTQITPALTSSNYNGAYYTTTADRVTTYHYVTVDAALTALQNDVTDNVALYGEQTVTQNFTIANKDTVTLADGATLVIGAKSGDDVTLTIAQGGKISLAAPVEKQITVNGTLYAEDFRNVNSIKSYIDSDVFSYAQQENGKQDNKSWAKWTNVYTALDQAASGDIVKLQKDVKLTKDVEIKDGVTLDADKYAVAVDNAVTLTVAGTLDLTDSAAKLTLADAVAKTSSTAAKAAGSVAISGYVQYTDDAQIPEKIAGAYYSITAKNVKVNYLTSYANGAADALKADSYAVAMKAGSDGKVALGDIAFAGESSKVVSVSVDGDLTGSITMNYAELFVDAGKKIDATFAGNGGSIAVKGQAGESSLTVAGTTYTFGFNVTDASYPAGSKTATEVIGFGGTIADYKGAKDANVDTALTVSGTVYAMSYMDVSVDAFTIAGTLTVTGEDGATGLAGAKASSADVQGSLVIIAGSDLTVADLTVSGAVAVQSGKLTADKAVVTGSVDATASENATAEFEVTHLYIGTDGKSFTGADASVTGNVDLVDYALAVPGATVPSSFNGADSAYVKTAYTVGNAAYLDAYGVTANTMTIASVAYSQENAKFLGWQNDKGVVATTELVGAAGFTSVSAKVDTAIYTVQITTDGGINYITLDGALLTNSTGNVFVSAPMAAGTHTIVFQGKAGYDISKVKIYQNGSEVTAISFSGDTDYKTVEYQLIGSTASATSGQSTVTIDVDGIIKAIEDNTKEIKNKETNVTVNGGSSDDDNDLTNILLVVLVILILVMAILVAYRMMRS